MFFFHEWCEVPGKHLVFAVVGKVQYPLMLTGNLQQPVFFFKFPGMNLDFVIKRKDLVVNSQQYFTFVNIEREEHSVKNGVVPFGLDLGPFFEFYSTQFFRVPRFLIEAEEIVVKFTV